MSDTYQGRCIKGPYDGEWRFSSESVFPVWTDDRDDRPEAFLGAYFWLLGQWDWSSTT
jgi:hypothetical protein